MLGNPANLRSFEDDFLQRILALQMLQLTVAGTKQHQSIIKLAVALPRVRDQAGAASNSELATAPECARDIMAVNPWHSEGDTIRRAEPSRAESNRAELSRAEPSRAEQEEIVTRKALP